MVFEGTQLCPFLTCRLCETCMWSNVGFSWAGKTFLLREKENFLATKDKITFHLPDDPETPFLATGTFFYTFQGVAKIYKFDHPRTADKEFLVPGTEEIKQRVASSVFMPNGSFTAHWTAFYLAVIAALLLFIMTGEIFMQIYEYLRKEKDQEPVLKIFDDLARSISAQVPKKFDQVLEMIGPEEELWSGTTSTFEDTKSTASKEFEEAKPAKIVKIAEAKNVTLKKERISAPKLSQAEP